MTFTRSVLLSTALLSTLFISGCSSPGGDGHQSHSASFSHSLGTAMAKDSGARCSIGLSAPSGSAEKGQKINFVLERSDNVAWTTHEFPIATGSAKSLGELQSQLGSALRRGLTAPAGSELTKVGNIEFGGEVRLVARGGGAVDFAYKPALEGGNPSLSAGETAAFAQLLGK